MRCEAKHAETKKIALNIGNFKNICKTLADRHQMKQATRFLLIRGLPGKEITVSHLCECITLNRHDDGEIISEKLGRYGLFREIYSTEVVSVNSVKFKSGNVIAYRSE